jgi:hypothetical protein
MVLYEFNNPQRANSIQMEWDEVNRWPEFLSDAERDRMQTEKPWLLDREDVPILDPFTGNEIGKQRLSKPNPNRVASDVPVQFQEAVLPTEAIEYLLRSVDDLVQEYQYKYLKSKILFIDTSRHEHSLVFRDGTHVEFKIDDTVESGPVVFYTKDDHQIGLVSALVKKMNARMEEVPEHWSSSKKDLKYKPAFRSS